MNEQERPVRWIMKILRAVCPTQLLEEIEGDLLQRFHRDKAMHGETRAKRKLVWNTVRYLRAGIILRNRFSLRPQVLPRMMGHFKMARRRLAKQRAFAFIHVAGLAVGMAAFFLIVQFVRFEMSYDRFHTNADNLYRVGLERHANGDLREASSKTFAGMRALLKEHFPEVRAVTAFYQTPANTGFLFRYNGKIFNEPGGVLNADSAFFQVFPSLLVKGDAATALAHPHHLVISESMARKIFGAANPIGQRLERIDDYDTGVDFIVTGVLKDIPPNAHVHAGFIRHIDDTWPDQEYWKDAFLHTYLEVAAGTDAESLAGRVNNVLRKMERGHPMVKGARIFLQPVPAIHLSSHYKDELESNGSQTLVYSLMLLGAVILAMAWINYLNLETARFVTRVRAVSVQRIIGSGKADLVWQFLTEYSCLTMAAIALAATGVYFLMPFFCDVTGIPAGYLHTEWRSGNVWMIAGGVWLAGSLVVSVYPFVVLMKLNPVEALKGRYGDRAGSGTVRKMLVTVQFVASFVLAAFVLVVREQVQLMRRADAHVELEHVIALQNPTAYSNDALQSKHNDYKVFEDKLLQNPSVKMLASSSAIPGTEIGFSYINLIRRTATDVYDPTVYKTLFVDHHFVPVYGLKLVAGKNFAPGNQKDAWIEPWQDKHWNTIVLNEKAVRQLGFGSPEAAINQVVDFQLFDDFQKYTIIGVVEDYHHEAVKKEVYPTIFAHNYSTFQQVYFSIRLEAGSHLPTALAAIQKSWTEVFPERPFDYFFLNDYYHRQFQAEEHFEKIFSAFAAVAIFLACLGILGITLFEANARLKEISIRKVLGASAVHVVALLSRDHVRVVMLAAVVAAPLLYYIINRWLALYPVRVELSVWYFVLPLAAIMLLVAVTSFAQTLKAALTNPVDHLKHE